MVSVGVFICRAQPPHRAHMMTVRHALSKVDTLVVVMGSHEQARTVKNPWTTVERVGMIRSCLTDDEALRIRFVAVKDSFYSDNQWVAELQREVGSLPEVMAAQTVTLFGHAKDASSYYLHLFPRWTFEETPLWEPLDAATVRMRYFTYDRIAWSKMVEPTVVAFLDAFAASPDFIELRDEYQYAAEYRESWRGAPFPPTFVTVDAVVVCSGHVLVTRRRSRPGKGLIALPGGFVSQKETLVAAALRELKEETSIRLTREELQTKITEQRVFDHPERSIRGRTITHAFCINLGMVDFPKVKGDSDADKAWWMPLNDVTARWSEFFEDHAHIIKALAERF